MQPKVSTRDFDILEITPPSSAALKSEIKNIIGGSQELSAAVESVNPDDGSYRVILQGKLGSQDSVSGRKK